MQLLGPYNSRLQAFHYQELLNLYKEAIAAGDFAGDQTFDITALNTLIQQSNDFSTLPLPSAEQRVTDDSLNNPLDLLTARFNAITSEANDFSSRAAGLISVIKKDTRLLDILISSAGLQSWIASLPKLTPSQQFNWDFGMGAGASSNQITQQDPANGVIYITKCPTNTYLDAIEGDINTGLVAPSTDVSVPPQSMQWQWLPMTVGEQAEDLYGVDWAELNLLETDPILTFLSTPAVNVQLPLGGTINGVFNVAGQTINGSIPVYVRILFVPRRNNTVITTVNAISDFSFENGGSGWTFGAGWTLGNNGQLAHTGLQYANKAPLSIWSSATTYHINNPISYLGKEYLSLTTNTNSVPNKPGTTDWTPGGILSSPVFPLDPMNNVYIEGWLLNTGANGIVTIQLTCLDHAGVPISPSIAIPGVSAAEAYLEVSEILQAISDPGVVFGRIDLYVTGQTTGTWQFDDIRVHLPQNISPYQVNQDNISVYMPLAGSVMPQTVFFENDDFVIDDISNVTVMGLPDGEQFTVRFTEDFPAYQCSINETIWSPVVMLDPNRPYPDTETNFDPISITNNASGQRTLFPITDEQGVPTGMTLEIVGVPSFQYYFLVTTPATPQFGATAVLEIDLSSPTYMNGLVLSPFSTYPVRITKVETESFTSDTRQTVGLPNQIIDRPMLLTFPTTLLSKIYLTCYQENYTLSELVAEPPDSLRRDTLVALQTVLPFNVRRPSRAVPIYYRGAQYAIGLEDIAGIASTPILPGVFISGPYHFDGCPDVYRFDADVVDPNSSSKFNAYMCWKAYNSSGVVVNSELVGVGINEGGCAAWPFPLPSILDRSTIDHVDIFLKFVIRDPEVVLQRFLLQVSDAG